MTDIAPAPGRAALLVMDYQVGVVSRYSGDNPALVERTATVLTATRQRAMPVVYIRVAFRPGYPELHPNNKTFRGTDKARRFEAGDPSTEIDARLAPVGNEPVVTKRRVGAFRATELDQILRSLGVSTLVLTGIATSGVVLSTVRDGADRDYELVVLSDCCTDGDPKVHRVLMERVFPRQATVIDSQQWLASDGLA